MKTSVVEVREDPSLYNNTKNQIKLGIEPSKTSLFASKRINA